MTHLAQGAAVAARALLPFLLATASTALGAEPGRSSAPDPLVGAWSVSVEGQAVTLELKADGTCALAGEPCRWSSAEGRLQVDEEQLGYRVEGDRLLLTDSSGRTVSWVRRGSAERQAKRPPPAEAAEPVAR